MLHKTPIIDKNGKLTHVWKKDEPSTSAARSIKDVSVSVSSPTKEWVDDDGFAMVPLGRLSEFWSPLLDDIWGVGIISMQDVTSCEDLELGKKPYELTSAEESNSRDYHIARIAWLYHNGWDDIHNDVNPISIDVGLAGQGYVQVTDGNHRLAAAIFRGHTKIKALICGDIDKAEAIFVDGLHPDDYGF